MAPHVVGTEHTVRGSPCSDTFIIETDKTKGGEKEVLLLQLHRWEIEAQM